MMHGSLGNSMANLKTFFFSKFSKVFQKIHSILSIFWMILKMLKKKFQKSSIAFPREQCIFTLLSCLLLAAHNHEQMSIKNEF